MENGGEWVSWLRSLELIVDMVRRGRKLEVDMEGKAQHGYSVMIRDTEEPNYGQSIVWGVPTFKWANHADEVYGLLERLLEKLPHGSAVQTRRNVATATSSGSEASATGSRPEGLAGDPPDGFPDIFTTPPVENWTTWADWLHLAAGVLHLTHIGHHLEVRVDDHVGRGSTLTMIDLDASGDQRRVVWESAFLNRRDADSVGSFMAGNLERLATRAVLYDEINARIVAEVRQPKSRKDRAGMRARLRYLLDMFPRLADETPPAWLERVEVALSEARTKRDVHGSPDEALTQGGDRDVGTGAAPEDAATESSNGDRRESLKLELLSDLRAALSGYPRVQDESLRSWFDRVIPEHVAAPEYRLAHALGMAEGLDVDMLSGEFETQLRAIKQSERLEDNEGEP